MKDTLFAAKVGIVNYGAGNLKSVENAFKAIGVQAKLITTPSELETLTHLVLPGQGEFGDCASKLKESGFFPAILEWIAADKPFLGICVGYQLLFEGSDESPDTPGLGVFRGQVKRFSQTNLKVPHMGWNAIKASQPSDPIWQGLEPNPYFYYVHSYYPEAMDETHIACTTQYGDTFHGAVKRGRLFATQFHPEKSQDAGLQLLRNFILTTSSHSA